MNACGTSHAGTRLNDRRLQLVRCDEHPPDALSWAHRYEHIPYLNAMWITSYKTIKLLLLMSLPDVSCPVGAGRKACTKRLRRKSVSPSKMKTRRWASITFQNYFRLYDKLSGMTGTADTEAFELNKIYGLEVVVIPTHRKMIRKDMGDIVYLTAEEENIMPSRKTLRSMCATRATGISRHDFNRKFRDECRFY